MLLYGSGINDLGAESEECSTNLRLELSESNIQTAIQSVAAHNLTIAGRQDNSTGARIEQTSTNNMIRCV